MFTKRTTPLDTERFKGARTSGIHRLHCACLVTGHQLTVYIQLSFSLMIGVRSPRVLKQRSHCDDLSWIGLAGTEFNAPLVQQRSDISQCVRHDRVTENQIQCCIAVYVSQCGGGPSPMGQVDEAAPNES